MPNAFIALLITFIDICMKPIFSVHLVLLLIYKVNS